MGRAEIWTLEGGGNWWHPVHMHCEEGRILKVNGATPSAKYAGRRDMYVLEPGMTMEVLVQWRDFKGKYVMHCHNSPHEDHGMMVRFDVS
jgi:FtsP/CotA-like multicopper oxidase with cupredoxin domain